MAKKSKPKSMQHDPFAEREAEKYDNPIPSREYIMSLLDEAGRPLSFKALAEALKIDAEEQLDALRYRLRAMGRDGQIMQDRRKRYCLMSKLSLIKGRVLGHPDGFGFVEPEDGGDDLFITPRQMRKVLHGDIVLARKIGEDRRGRPEGVIHEVLEHINTYVVGRFYDNQGIAFVDPENQRLTQDIFIAPEDTLNAKEGQVVMAEIIAQPNQRTQPIGRVTEIIGEHMAPGMEIDIALRAYGIPYEWPQSVLDEAQRYDIHVHEKDWEGRTDLRDKALVTIDGEDAKDFDDAVYCEPRSKGGWRLLVAIADVSHYVKAGSALDQEAIQRGNSVYFPGRVVPMLPEILSNGLCSLKPKVDRLCMVCDMAVSAKGKLERYRFYPAVMHSQARLTYTKVAAMLVDKDANLREEYKTLVPHLENLFDLYQTLAKAREQRGAIEFETTETQIEFDENKKIKAIHPLHRNEAHRLIEECMLMANVATARFLKSAKLPSLYRVHDKPGEERLTQVREFLAELGLSLGGGKKPTAKHYSQVITQTRGRPDAHIIQILLLRSMSQAVYHETNIGHFGLAYEAYTHFTSPIRRYPDLLIHRTIKFILSHQEPSEFEYSDTDIHRFGRSCSKTERRADEATRDVAAWLKCEFLLDKVGEVFEGVISSVTSFGIFVELIETYVEGLVHVTNLPDDYYDYDPVRHRLTGARSGKIFHLGDKVTVQVARVDLDERKIDFELLSS